jgi:L-seryl-tRNA(Ser) seleniumtransferase
MSGPPEILKLIPKVEKVIAFAQSVPELKKLSHARLLKAVRLTLSDVRTEILENRRSEAPLDEEIIGEVKKKALNLNRAKLRPLINATGVVLHTNLGRAPLATEALDRVRLTAQSYTNLEYDPLTGQRADRQKPLEELLTDLTGAEAAVVLNNNAAALFLLATTIAKGKKVIVSRGELVEIGGSFRLSDIIEAAGAKLIEVGSTNQTRIEDYRKAASDEDAALILKVHASNFRQTGYASQTDLEELSEVARAKDLPLVADLGSGTLIDLAQVGLNETPIKKAIANGADAVCLSADKLFGGPQAGIVLGRKKIVSLLKTHPLARIVRPGKLTIAALEATLLLAQDQDEAKVRIPVWRMLFVSDEKLKAKAISLKKFLGAYAGLKLQVVPTQSQAGGGAAPEQPLSSWAVAIESLVNNVALLEEKLRRQEVPVVARVRRDQLILDVRAIAKNEFSDLKKSLTKAWNELVGQP